MTLATPFIIDKWSSSFIWLLFAHVSEFYNFFVRKCKHRIYVLRIIYYNFLFFVLLADCVIWDFANVAYRYGRFFICIKFVSLILCVFQFYVIVFLSHKKQIIIFFLHHNRIVCPLCSGLPSHTSFWTKPHQIHNR